MKSRNNLFKASKLAVLVAVLGGGLTACQSSTNTADTDEYRVDNDSQQVAEFEGQPEQQPGDADKIFNDPDMDTANSEYNYSNTQSTQEVSRVEPPAETTVNFAFDSAELSSEARNALQELNEKLTDEEYENLRVVISGYADAVGDRDYNQDLSERRAQSVKDYLQYDRSDVADIEVQGYGESNPVMENDSEYGRQQNRRVEISFEMEDANETYSMQ